MAESALDIKIRALVEGLANVTKLSEELRDTGAAAKGAGVEAQTSADKTENAYKTLGVRAFSEIRAEIDKVKAAYAKLADSGKLSSDELANASTAVKSKLAGLNQEMAGVAPATGAAGNAMSGLASHAALLAGSFLSLGAALGGVKKASEAAIELDRMHNAMQATIGSSEGAQKEYAFVRAEADRLGLSLQNSAKDYTTLTAATKGTTLAGEQTRAIFTAVSEASSVLGLSADSTSGALQAIQQMVSKGTVSAEELRGQLGERLPGAFQIAARAMGVTTAELGKMLESGSVASDVFLPKFAAELRKTFSDGLPGAVSSARAEFERLQNTIFETAAAVGQSGLNQGLAEAAHILRDKLNDPAVQQGLKDLGKSIGDIAIAAAKMSGEIKVIGEVLIAGAVFTKLTGGATAAGAAALAAGEKVGLLRLALMGLAAVAPYLTAALILYQVAKAGSDALVEYAEAHRKLSAAEQQRVTDLRAQITQLEANIAASQRYGDVQILSAEAVLKLSPAQLAAYRAELEEKKKLEVAEYGLALRKQELAKYQVQEAISTGKSKDMIALYTAAQKTAGEEAAVWSGKIAQSNEALKGLGAGAVGAGAAIDGGLTPAAAKLVAAFDAAIAKSPEVATALKNVFEGFNPNNMASVQALLDALENIGKSGKASALEIRTAFEKELKELPLDGLLRLQTVVNATGKEGSEAAGLITLALEEARKKAGEAGDEFARMGKQATDAAQSLVTVGRAHLDLVRADADVGRARIAVWQAQNKYAKDGTDLAAQELQYAQTTLKLAQAKAEQARLHHAQEQQANNVLIAQQEKMNALAQLNIAIKEKGDIAAANAAVNAAQKEVEGAQQTFNLTKQKVLAQQEVVLQLEEEAIKQKLVVDQAAAAAAETRKMAEHAGNAASNFGHAAHNAGTLTGEISAAADAAKTLAGNAAEAANQLMRQATAIDGIRAAQQRLDAAQGHKPGVSTLGDGGTAKRNANVQSTTGENKTYADKQQDFSNSAEENRYWDFIEGKAPLSEQDRAYVDSRWQAAQANLATMQANSGAYSQNGYESALKKYNEARRAMESLGSSGGASLRGPDDFGSGGFAAPDTGDADGFTAMSDQLLDQIKQTGLSTGISLPSNAVQSVASQSPSKVIQVNFTNDSGQSVPVTVDAANEGALLDLLQKAKGIAS